MNPIFLEPIVTEPPRKEIYRRLGYREKTTALSAEERHRIEDAIDEAYGLVHLKAVGLRLPVLAINDEGVIIRGTRNVEIFHSKQLAKFLAPSDEVLLMGATTGKQIMEAINKETQEGRLNRAVIFDAVASEMVDAALDWVMGYFRHTLLRENRVLSDNRYSAGYGDFLLENQRIFYRLLNLVKLDVQITETCLLIPEKSVTAVAGIIRKET